MNIARLNFRTARCIQPRTSLTYFSTVPPETDGEIKITPPKAYSDASDSGGNNNNSGRPKSRFFVKSLGFGVLLGLGGVIYGSYYHPEFRRTLEDNVPYINVALTPTMRAMNYVLNEFDFSIIPTSYRSSKPESSPTPPARPAPFVPPQSTEKKENLSSAPSAEPEKPKPVYKEPVPEKKSPPPAPVVDREAEVKAEMQRLEKVKQQKNEELSRQLDQLLRSVQSLTKVAMKDLTQLETETRNHAHVLQKAIEADTTEEERSTLWSAAYDVSHLKKDKKAASESSLQKAQNEIQELKNIINEGLTNPDTKANPSLIEAQTTVTKLQYDLSTAVSAMHKAESEYSMVSKYKDLVTSSQAQFQKELESILPEVDVQNKSGQLTRDELHALLVHAHRRINQLHKHLAEKEAMDKARLTTALEQQKREDDKLAAEMVEREIERMKNEAVLQKKEWEAIFRKEVDDELRQILAAQAAAHNDHLRDVLRVQMEALKAAHELDIRQYLLKERESFYAAIQGWINRVKGIEAAVEGRAEAEEEARTSQELWLATQALLNATEGFHFEADDQYSLPLWANQTVNLFRRSDSRLPALRPLLRVTLDMAAKAKADFIVEMATYMPQKAVDEGVCSEEQLVKRFQKVKRICRRVSMVNENGASIPMIILSWLQSVFVFERSRALGPDDEVVLLSDDSLNSVDHQTVTVLALDRERQVDTFILLRSAERALNAHNLELAVRFMGQLRGAPAAVAQDWLEEARLLLETRQVIKAMRASASARGLAGVILPDGSTIAPAGSSHSTTSITDEAMSVPQAL